MWRRAYLHSGDAETFSKHAKSNVEALAAAVRSGHDIVVPQPTCSYVLKNDYLDYVGGSDAKLVAANTYDVCEYLMRVHQDEGTSSTPTFSVMCPRRSPTTRRVTFGPRTSGSRAET